MQMATLCLQEEETLAEEVIGATFCMIKVFKERF